MQHIYKVNTDKDNKNYGGHTFPSNFNNPSL